jgi:hypothetical protein
MRRARGGATHWRTGGRPRATRQVRRLNSFAHAALFDQVCRFAHHERGSVGVARGHGGKDRGVCAGPRAPSAVRRRPPLGARAHAQRPVLGGLGVVADPGHNLGRPSGSRSAGPGAYAGRAARPSVRPDDASDREDALHHGALVDGVGQKLKRIAGCWSGSAERM